MAVAAPTRTLEKGSRSRERLLDVASRLMADRGFAATSVSRICEEARLPPSSLYWHFGSKEELLAAVMERGAQRWLADLPSWHGLPGDAEARLARSLEEIATRLAAHPEFLRLYILLSIERREVDATAIEPIRRVREQAISGWRAMLRAVLLHETTPVIATQLADALARFALCFCDGCFVSHQVDPAATDLARMFDDLRIGLLAIARGRLAKLARPPTASRAAPRPRARKPRRGR